ncbi:hypothetical protein [Capnocytophaga sp. oral taxon 336]|jgi:hypothetical protein|uniref:hypothetical protein n=1 Tax=Capnocytophaga sp. oral taxon 336 TaxID=712216 RepID=UPI00034E66E2|nr:hypothetical protein [Capnocytophaga sp. oral taxon 336]EPD99630.1 hypothetical protein HMPREF1528_01551 [Capnocytophaga sp. oral taxon 336 str. F0502]
MKRQDEIEKVYGNKTHVVLLGAGASYASTLRNPEKNGKKLPLMKNIVDIVGLTDIVNGLPIEYKELKDDFEKLYSKICCNEKFNEEKKIIEEKIYEYFDSLDLPDEPTIYDYLILSLRKYKDTIATFNWDPFLYKAYHRNMPFVESPAILFLHGNVSIGLDKNSGETGPAGMYSKKTNAYFEPTKLLYPIDKKDYSSDDYIKNVWKLLSKKLKEAKRVTVFGYSAPVSDVEAIDLLSNAWGKPEDRTDEQFEFIDVRSEDDIIKSWKRFIFESHYDYCDNYFKSSLALHPRRSVENYYHRFFPFSPSEMFQKGNKVPKNFSTLEELWEWHRPLIEAENKFMLEQS